MKVKKITPRGYCHGVVNALNTVLKTDLSTVKKPVYILGMLLHNKQLIKQLDEKGIITLDLHGKTRYDALDEIEQGTVIFTAHGVSDRVVQKAISKKLDIIDTTCQDVEHSHDVMKKYINDGYHMIYIGKKGHPESEAALELSENVTLITTLDEAKELSINKGKIALTNQTTMSIYDIYNIIEELTSKIPSLVVIDEICDATRIRQEAVAAQKGLLEFIYVVGDKLSNNSNKLVEVAQLKAQIPSKLIESVKDINIEDIKKYQVIGVTSGASTPTRITNEVIEFLEKL